MNSSNSKILVIRFSSFGDIVQAMEVLAPLEGQIDWVTRREFCPLVELNSKVNKVWGLERSTGLLGLLRLARQLRGQGYTHIYDAHSNLRSGILRCYFRLTFSGAKILRRKKDRLKRFLLFKLGINKFSWPFRGRVSYLEALKDWGIKSLTTTQSWKFPEQFSKQLAEHHDALVLVPSAAWEMKRWPLENWKELISIVKHPKIIVLGGPGDEFCSELEGLDPKRVTNLAGKLSLTESAYILSTASNFVSADTGLLHVGDLLGVSGLSLIGPTAFGFPSGDNVKILESDLSCRPCSKDGRGGCSREIYQECMLAITPEVVAKALAP
ncbi:MAG: glycosyltransferase family 9 protein [Halobacteriovoraceae bacterium]|jgi:ADP-heptose:LPS heptosyltransferase|nr:glycosyltransferase family 9 protein [Halobacteriovoraceae bacterium]MBT5095004.1 glycosyltransferase family 9 protein [Halobacteriovoraceae bacterium]